MRDNNNLVEIFFVVLAATLFFLSVLTGISPSKEKSGQAVGAKPVAMARSKRAPVKPYKAKIRRVPSALNIHDVHKFNDFCEGCLAIIFIFSISYSLVSRNDQSRNIVLSTQEKLLQMFFGGSKKVAAKVPDILPNGTLLNFGRVEIIAPLGFGGMSTTYRAKLGGTKIVCLKESVIPEYVEDAIKIKWKELIAREAQLLSRLHHEQIAQVFEFFSENGRDYLVLEFVQGVSLRDLVRQHGPQSEQSVLKWALEIAYVLDYMHNQRLPIIHRDLTPDNVILKRDGSVVLIDFGAANECVGQITGTSIGKRCYMPPEQFRGKASPASDIYALGATMHFLLTGSEPVALSASHPNQINQDVSAETDLLVAQCTQLLQSNRICFAKQLALRIEQTLHQRNRQAPVWNPAINRLVAPAT
jgi:tRNA A-37 threonylcarbamoyl transferase component Bud32